MVWKITGYRSVAFTCSRAPSSLRQWLICCDCSAFLTAMTAAKLLTRAACGDGNSHPQRQWMQPGKVLAESTWSSQKTVTIMFVIFLNWPQAKAVGQAEVFLHWPMEFCYLYHGCGEKTCKWIMEDFKQSASCCLETIPWFSYSKAIKKIPGFLESFLTPNYISPWHGVLTVMLKDLGSRGVLTK